MFFREYYVNERYFFREFHHCNSSHFFISKLLIIGALHVGMAMWRGFLDTHPASNGMGFNFNK